MDTKEIREEWEGTDPQFYMEELQPNLDLLPDLEHYAHPIGDEQMISVTYAEVTR